MLNQLINKVVDVLEPENGYPAYAGAYGGQLRNPKSLVKAYPSVYVDLNSGDLQAADTIGRVLQGPATIEIIMFEENHASAEDRHMKGLNLLSWVVRKLKGQTIEIEGVKLFLSKQITFRTVTDLPEYVAIVSIPVTITERAA